METELKLKVAQGDLDRLREHALLADLGGATPEEHQLKDTYFDTPQLDLWHNGLTLRVRADGDQWIQTVKTAHSGSAGLHERGEWESLLAGPEPDPAAVARQVKQKRIAELLRAPNIVNALRPVFNNTTRRTLWNLVLPGGQKIECVLDAGDIHVGGRNAPIGELELELKRGDPTPLFALALTLHNDIPLQIANDSKAARGYALLDGTAPPPVKAQPVRLTRKMRLEEALQCMGLNCLQQLEANVPGVLAGSVESLHQMRVGLRRLRALLDMFGDIAPLPEAVRDSLEWLAGELGGARDWDVLAGSTLPRIKGADLGALRATAEQRAQELHRALLPALRQPRYTQLILQLNGWFHGRQWRADGLPKDSPLRQRAHEAMAPLLEKAQRRLRKRIDALDEEDAPARHRVRIAAKKARYAAEFFHDLLPVRAAKRYIHVLSALQDKLGLLNDLAVADTLLDDLAARGPADDIRYARGYVIATSEAESHHLREALDDIARLKLLK
ncbi:CYTH and CHAD domain-containing protein [Pseudoduganella umbonata]|uniref:CHAD domain-containing protein n=1 Tax=Pseudoduganella umbonata TaxID=864828 RepID=A0A4P8HMP9_9BURK|nr:CYTH and CHAD domain-containing protein [Pseudoduganella umbonata]MBB3219605.1 inorganic triphosphatase YgiF [Pseudoduganella umbonata]QCP09672.1 CHAD domain-containing protein [Pseudoduganella umbonata]